MAWSLFPLVLTMSLAGAGGTDVTAALDWERRAGGEDCLSPPEVQSLVEARAGRPVFTRTGEAPLRLRGTIGPALDDQGTGAPGRWTATLELRDAAGEVLGRRALQAEGATCRALEEPTVLVIALMLDFREPPPAPPPPPIAPRRPARAELAAGGAGSWGELPTAAVGAMAELRLRTGGLPPLALQGTWWHPTETDTDRAGGRFSVQRALIALCPGRQMGRFDLSLCGGFGLSRWRSRGEGLDRSYEDARWVPDLEGAADLTVAIWRWVGLRAQLGAVVPLRRDSFLVDEGPAADSARRVHRQSFVHPRAGLGLVARFP